jgi:endoglucanase
VGQYGMTRGNHETLIRRTAAAIQKIDFDREIVIDGAACGHPVLYELAHNGAVHSGRGYQPMALTHYKAPW